MHLCTLYAHLASQCFVILPCFRFPPQHCSWFDPCCCFRPCSLTHCRPEKPPKRNLHARDSVNSLSLFSHPPKDGSLVYWSKRDECELIHYTAEDVERAHVTRVPEADSCKPFAFEAESVGNGNVPDMARRGVVSQPGVLPGGPRTHTEWTRPRAGVSRQRASQVELAPLDGQEDVRFAVGSFAAESEDFQQLTTLSRVV